VSFTVIVNEQFALFGGVAASLTEQFTVVTPLGNVDPLGGLQVGVPTPEQLSLTVGVEYVTAAEHAPLVVETERFAGHVIVGA